MNSLDGLKGIRRSGGGKLCFEYDSWSEVPSPKTFKILHWEDHTSQVMVFHTDVKGHRHLWLQTGDTPEIDKLITQIREEQYGNSNISQ